MKLTKRPLRWAIVLVLLVLVGLGAYAYFIGTRTFLEYAEAFQFRRMTVNQLTDQGDFRFFYATNRVQGTAETGVDGRFEPERETILKLGSFDTRIEPTLGLGMLINPSEWFLNEDIGIESVDTLDQETFVEQLRTQVQASPRQSLLMIVHGFREAFPTALRRTAFVAHVLDLDTPVLVFDWPGNQGSSLRGYRRARQVATESGAELAETLRLVIEQVQPERLWLMANSMGAQVVVHAFSLLYQDPEFSDPQTEIANVVLSAPDADHEEFNNRFKQELKALTKSVTVYVSSNDRALLVSRLLNRGRRLGESTLDPTNPDHTQVASSVSDLVEPGDGQIVLVDVTPVNRTRNFHNFSLETPEFFDDLFRRFTGDGLPESRELYQLETPEGKRYFVMTRGR